MQQLVVLTTGAQQQQQYYKNTAVVVSTSRHMRTYAFVRRLLHAAAAACCCCSCCRPRCTRSTSECCSINPRTTRCACYFVSEQFIVYLFCVGARHNFAILFRRGASYLICMRASIYVQYRRVYRILPYSHDPRAQERGASTRNGNGYHPISIFSPNGSAKIATSNMGPTIIPAAK